MPGALREYRTPSAEWGRAAEDDGARTGIVESLGAGVDPSWMGRRIVVLDPGTADVAVVSPDGVVAVDPDRIP